MTKNHLLHLLIEVARRQLTPQEQTELRDALAPDASIGTPPPPGEYNTAQIAWELQETARGDHYGNALRVAKDIPGVTADDRALLDRYATGAQAKTDHVALQDLALRIRYGRLYPLHTAARTCDNCASSASTSPRCGQCTGATATTTQWEPKNSPTA